jgi:hypothetical protein
MKYGYEDGLKGIEANYHVLHDILFINISGSNHWTDYVKNFFAWPRKKVRGYRVHRWWFKLAQELVDDLPVDWDTIRIIKASGHSLGGAVASLIPLAAWPFVEAETKSYNAPKSGYTGPHHRSNYDKGDIVRHLPLLYPKYKIRKSYAHTKPFWKAHNNVEKYAH